MHDLIDAHKGVLDKLADDWSAFNKKVVGYPIPAQPELLSEDRAAFRADFKQEELDEFKKAQAAGDLDGAVDACIDLMYVTMGTLGEMGVLVQPVWGEVQAANMRKHQGELSKRPGSKGHDAVKPLGWTPPSHARYLTITKEEADRLLAERQSGFTCINWAEGLIRQLPEMHEGRNSWLLNYGSKAADVAAEPASSVETEQAKRDKVMRDWAERKMSFEASDPVDKSLGFRIMVMGHARHGKDTVCELLRDRYGARFTSSSWFCAERVVQPYLDERWSVRDLPNYETAQQCFDDRARHRKLWFDIITGYNTPDRTRLGRAIFEDHDVYCGIRNAKEFHALRNAGIFDVAIWVDASDREKPEDASSCTVEPWMADFVLDNNGSKEDLERNLSALMDNLMNGGCK